MKVLLCHTYYQQRGGEDESFEAEARTLSTHGHRVVRFTRHNDSIRGMSRWSITQKTIWNRQIYTEIRELIRQERPQIVHCTNTFPLLSPAVYYAARREGVPVVQSLRNYRLLCPSATFLRDSQVCEDCLGKSVPWPALQHKCYRDSRSATAAVVALNVIHRTIGTWHKAVDLYFTLTEFARQKFIQGGWPADRIVVKPNCVQPDPGPGSGTGGFAVFVGRLSVEKGISTLLEAWKQLRTDLHLKILGDGPLREQVIAASAADPRIQYLGSQPIPKVLEVVGDAVCLVMPSIWYETFGRTIIEAYARGTPVVASRLGAMAEIVRHGQTGWLVPPSDSAALANCLEGVTSQPETLSAMRVVARQEFEAKYTAEVNLKQLLEIYAQATAHHQQHGRRRRRSSQSLLRIPTHERSYE